ncbi:hypothetical protein [Paraburkholderia sp. BL21I4N1]|uniref:hypothetical protein n=1 Tax=Paraburkholderia sp. BL21I4N1 TaxID=1938801 RepID=UPI000CFB7245|nr:hypothetical protein [Paraburkholderia sp. BL21I4N1]PQV44121.1 hypothetical protein B0G83_12719 [Paraburkholderia sp. BL21I4N1]
MLYPILELQDIFVDACVRAPTGELMFLSTYGRDGSLQQLYAALHLGVQEGGIRQVTILDPASRQPLAAVPVGDPKRFDKFSGRLPKDNLFGSLVHTWIFDPCLMTPARATATAWLLVDRHTQHDDTASITSRAWSLIVQLSPVPLLPHWRERVLSALGKEIVTDLAETASAPVGRLHASLIVLPEAFRETLSTLVHDGKLTLEGDTGTR